MLLILGGTWHHGWHLPSLRVSRTRTRAGSITAEAHRSTLGNALRIVRVRRVLTRVTTSWHPGIAFLHRSLLVRTLHSGCSGLDGIVLVCQIPDVAGSLEMGRLALNDALASDLEERAEYNEQNTDNGKPSESDA